MMMTIRPVLPHESSNVAELYWSVWHETQAGLQPPEVAAFRTLSFFNDRVSGFRQWPLGGYIGGQLAGFAAWESNHLGQLFVRPDARRIGLGRQLLQQSEAAIWSAGFAAARLYCIVGNVAGRSFYERCGWVVASTFEDDAESAAGPVRVSAWEMVKRRPA